MKYNPQLESEHNKTGTCVTEQGRECREVKSGVSCRPGQIGVPSEFVFCPAKTKTRTTSSSSSSAGPDPVRPFQTLAETAGSANFPNVASNIQNVVKEIIGRK